jgi:CRP-like cAMP-binding protein
MINEDLLIRYGAQLIKIAKNQLLFQEGDRANFYFQIQSGEIKMNNYTPEGKEFIQSIFSKGRGFGEPPLLIDSPYPCNAYTTADSILFKLEKSAFLQLLQENPDAHLEFSKTICDRLHFKAIMAAELSYNEPEHRILTFIDYLKTHIYKLDGQYTYEVELKRQQIADLTGLRVETVIRAIKSLEKKGELKIIQRKVWR